jgi:class 3 adenylate cyclase
VACDRRLAVLDEESTRGDRVWRGGTLPRGQRSNVLAYFSVVGPSRVDHATLAAVAAEHGAAPRLLETIARTLFVHDAAAVWHQLAQPGIAARGGEARSDPRGSVAGDRVITARFTVDRPVEKVDTRRMGFRETELVLVTADLAGFARMAAAMPAVEVAELLDGWYGALEAVIRGRGGRVVKYIGDGCLATFPADACAAAVEAARELAVHHAGGHELRVGVRVHLGTVAEGEVGPDRRYDVFGNAVNDLFRMGRAGTVLISDAVHARLTDAERASWQAQTSPATFAPAASGAGDA